MEITSKIDWTKPLPYNHRWEKKYNSIFNPSGKVTWPQLLAEMTIFWRSRLIKNYPQIHKGPDWWRPFQKDIRKLVQQACAICNYFPHPDEEPLVVYAVKKFFREHKPLKLGQFRKTRISKKGKLNITQDEKDLVSGIMYELEKVLKSRELYKTTASSQSLIDPSTIKSGISIVEAKPMKAKSLRSLLELEKTLKSPLPKDDRV